MKMNIAGGNEVKEILTKIVRGQDVEQTTTTDEDCEGNTKSRTVVKSVPISAKVRAAKILLDDENDTPEKTEGVTVIDDLMS
jgi:hypothetical protein